ncbi:MAG: hypothetical protein J8272_00830, partial ['Prunus persica' phytoplasma PP2]|nr:hypothetical protein ['Prunus persica' phytoplasma PP2]
IWINYSSLIDLIRFFVNFNVIFYVLVNVCRRSPELKSFQYIYIYIYIYICWLWPVVSFQRSKGLKTCPCT